MSHQELADQIRTTSVTVSRIESGEPDGHLRLDTLAAVAAVFGIHTTDVMCKPETEPSGEGELADDAATLEAALLSAGQRLRAGQIATALGWSQKRVLAAAAELDRRLRPTGAALTRAKGFAILPREDRLTPGQQRALAAADYRINSLMITEARIAYQAIEGCFSASRLAEQEKVAVNKLRKAGFVTDAAGVIEATPDLLYNLGLTNHRRPPRQRARR